MFQTKPRPQNSAYPHVFQISVVGFQVAAPKAPHSFQVSFTFTEPVYPSREATAHHVELYLTGNVANAGRLLERCCDQLSAEKNMCSFFLV